MTVHASAHEQLLTWTARSATQDLLRRDFVQYLAGNLDGCDRSGRPDHLTASALVVNAERSRVLLCLHRKVGLWLQFGGHIESVDGSLANAALREATEESGIDGLTLVDDLPTRLDRHAAPCGGGARYHLDVQFVAVAPLGAHPVTSEESLDVAWFDPAALPEKTDDAVRALVDDAMSRA
ncbi:MAG: NUDIX hydrolase [Actinomycetes bacterium]